MSIYSPAVPYTVEYMMGDVVVNIPSSRKISWPLAAWALMWLVVIPVLAYLVITNINTAKGFNLLVPIALLVLSLFRVYPALALLAWQITGKETLEITPQAVTVRSQVVGIKRIRIYAAEFIDGIHVAPLGYRQFSFLRFGMGSFEVQDTGPIVLAYKGKKVTLGAALDYEHGKAIVAAIHQRLPQFNRTGRSR